MSRDKTILITGAAGFIASHIVDQFIENNYIVIGVDNLKTGNKKNLNKKLLFLEIDLNDKNAVKDIFKKFKPSVLIHQASNLVDVELSITNPSLAYQDLLMTTNLIEEARKNGLQHIIFSSSANVYGNPSSVPIRETARLAPTSPYGLTKLAIENYLAYFSNRYKIDFTVFRYFNVYGERQNTLSGAAIPTFIRQMIKNEPITINGGKQIRDFVYVKDVARANYLAGTKKITGIYNVGSGKSITINDVVRLIESLMEKKNKIIYSKQDQSDLQFSQASIARIKKKLGWTPEVSFAEGLNKTIAYCITALK